MVLEMYEPFLADFCDSPTAKEHPLFGTDDHSMQSPETRHFEALTELYLHSNNLTQLPSGRPVMVGLVSHNRKGLDT